MNQIQLKSQAAAAIQVCRPIRGFINLQAVISVLTVGCVLAYLGFAWWGQRPASASRILKASAGNSCVESRLATRVGSSAGPVLNSDLDQILVKCEVESKKR